MLDFVPLCHMLTKLPEFMNCGPDLIRHWNLEQLIVL